MTRQDQDYTDSAWGNENCESFIMFMLHSSAFGNMSVEMITSTHERLLRLHVFFFKNKNWEENASFHSGSLQHKESRWFLFWGHMTELWGCPWMQQRRRILAVRRSQVGQTWVGLPCSRAHSLWSCCSVTSHSRPGRCRWFLWDETFWLSETLGRWWVEVPPQTSMKQLWIYAVLGTFCEFYGVIIF